MSDNRQQREVLYSGNVQGVGFRFTVRSLAARFNVAGKVRNLPDGGVQLVVEGDRQELDEFLGAVKQEMGQYIRDAQQTVRPATGRFSTFEIVV